MKKSTGYLKYMAVLALIAALVALTVWITSMYRYSTTNYTQTADKCLTQAADEELRMRMISLGGKFETWFKPNSDTSTYVTKTIEVDDGSVFHVRIRKDDVAAMSKIRQFYFQVIQELNTSDIDSLFKRCMSENSLSLKASYVEYLDLKKNTLIASNAPEGKLSGYLASSVDTLDIVKTIGVRAHAKAPLLVLFRPVMTEFVVAVALMLIVVACIIKLIVDIRKLHREGFRLLRFVALKAQYSLNVTAEQLGDAAEKFREKGLEEEATETEKVREGVVITTGYFERLQKIIDNEEGKITFNKTVFCINTLVDELKERYEKIIYKHVSIRLTVCDDLYIYTDREYLKRIFEELLDNSVKHTCDPVPIEIVAAQMGNQIILIVCDCGGGISQSDLDNLYIVNHNLARYYNEAIKRETKSGLGLSFVSSFVRALGGMGKITSDDDMAGARMVFTLSNDDIQRIAQYKSCEVSSKAQGKTINLSDRMNAVN